DLLPRHRRRGDAGDAVDDVAAAADGERGQDADLPPARRGCQLPGVHDRAVSLAADGTLVHRYEAVGEEDRRPQSRDPRVDQPTVVVDDGRGPSGETEPDASGLV